MKNKFAFVTAGALVAVAAVTVWAVTGTTKTFRTPTGFTGIFQDTSLAGKPQFDIERYQGHDLVNLALGTSLSTARSNEVLALEVDCDSSVMNLVVFDKAAGSNLVTIAISDRVDVVQQQDKDSTAFPNRERFVAHFNVAATGNSTNGLVAGYLTVAGRLHLNPTNGCPRAVRVDSDRREDRVCGDLTGPKPESEVDRIVRIAGRAHYIGVLDIVSGGTTNTLLVPNGMLFIKRQLSE